VRRPLPAATPIEGRRPPLWLVVVLLVAFEVPGLLHALRHLPDVTLVDALTDGVLVLELVALAVLSGVVLVGRYPRSVGWVPRTGVRRPVQLIAVAMVVTSIALVGSAAVELGWSAAQIGVVVVNVLAIAAFEETMFRGMLWAALPAAWGAARVLLVTSVLFGAWHMLNGLVTGSWGGAAVQAVFAAFLGLGLGAIRLRSGWLGLGVLTHAAIDAGVTAAGLAGPEFVSDRSAPPVLGLALLVFEALYVTIAVTGVVVLIRAWLAERRGRRSVTAVAGAATAPG
jgi:membrane protease YdiL (CAAX protease family)